MNKFVQESESAWTKSRQNQILGTNASCERIEKKENEAYDTLLACANVTITKSNN